jgi:hypothetical protein
VSVFASFSAGLCANAPCVRLNIKTLIELGFALTVFVTVAVSIVVRAWVIFDMKRRRREDLRRSFAGIFDHIDSVLTRGLACWGSDQISAAAEVAGTIRDRLGKTLKLSGDLSGLLKRLDEAVAGLERQEQVCSGAAGKCAGAGLISATASKNAVVNVYGNVESFGGGDGGAPCALPGAPNSPCLCGEGEWRRMGSTPARSVTRLHPMSTSEHILAARQAMVALKEKWVRQTILDALEAAHKELAQSKPWPPPS